MIEAIFVAGLLSTFFYGYTRGAYMSSSRLPTPKPRLAPTPREMTDHFASPEWRIQRVTAEAMHAMIEEAIKPGNQRR